MRIQFVSDLHLEFQANQAYLAEHPLVVTGDMLLVAGDTAYLDLPETKKDTYSRILSNQLGYVSYAEKQANGFDPGRCIDV